MAAAAIAATRGGLKVFVGNLPWTISSTELRHFGASFGQVAHAHVVFNRSTGMSKGFGFLIFSNKEGYENMLKVGGGSSHSLEGNYLTCSPAGAATQH